jgi:protein-S-isoprenylcysteine O-methyltransferase Ste14
MNLSPLHSDLARLALLGYLLASFLFAFALRSWWVWRRTGINPLVLPATDDVAGYVARGFRLCILICVGIAVAVAVGPAGTPCLGVWSTAPDILVPFGWAVLVVALGLMLLAQSQMGTAWRIGIDSARATSLVTHGLFGWSRNPIFLAMRLILAGLVLLVPAAITLVLLALAEVLIQVQVRLEEAHLSALHGARYEHYRAHVARWLGRRHENEAQTQ